jgi:hypothetical protein
MSSISITLVFLLSLCLTECVQINNVHDGFTDVFFRVFRNYTETTEGVDPLKIHFTSSVMLVNAMGGTFPAYITYEPITILGLKKSSPMIPVKNSIQKIDNDNLLINFKVLYPIEIHLSTDVKIANLHGRIAYKTNATFARGIIIRGKRNGGSWDLTKNQQEVSNMIAYNDPNWTHMSDFFDDKARKDFLHANSQVMLLYTSTLQDVFLAFEAKLTPLFKELITRFVSSSK